MARLDFTVALTALAAMREETVAGLRDHQTPALLQRKRELDDAIGCLTLCLRHQIDPRARVVTIPDTLTRTPSSELRLIEDHESDDRRYWQEVVVDGKSLRPSPGDLLIQR